MYIKTPAELQAEQAVDIPALKANVERLKPQQENARLVAEGRNQAIQNFPIKPNIPALLQQTVPQQAIPTPQPVPAQQPATVITEGPGASPQYYATSQAAGGNFYDAVHKTMPTLKALGGIPERERG